MITSTKKEYFGSYDAGKPDKPRSLQEVTARYNLRLQQYKELNASQEDNREQRLMLYTEIKVLGWLLGKAEKKILKEIHACSA